MESTDDEGSTECSTEAETSTEAKRPHCLWRLGDIEPRARWAAGISAMSAVGEAMAVSVYQFFCLRELGMKQMQIGVAMAAFQLSATLGNVLLGRLSDALGRRRVAVACWGWIAATLALTSLSQTFHQFLACRAAAGLGGAGGALVQAMIGDVSTDSSRPSLLGMLGLVCGVAFGAGGIFTAVALHLGATRRTMFGGASLMHAVAFLLSAAGLPETLPEQNRRAMCRGKASVWPGAAESCAIINRGLCLVWLARVGTAFATLSWFATYASLVERLFHWGAGDFSLILCFSGGWAALMQGFAFPRLRRALGKHGVAILGMVKLALGQALIAASWELREQLGQSLAAAKTVHIAGAWLCSSGLGLFEPAFADLVAAYVADPGHMGAAQGATNSLRTVASIVAPLVASIIYGEFGGGVSYLCAAGPSALSALAVAAASVLGVQAAAQDVDGAGAELPRRSEA